ncbi:glycosyl transferase [Thermomonospora umbrina]|uniref:Glycosyl transferase n=1 Tax=Thermomonospora umbrina TaxID=111806 RepID=A0A3D9T1S7_9ACTN|nr:glycosyl transferase [Thermomonospora umbrina]REE98704.1 hypothetical protein DFJ69_4197 [Thermomonospora umbrina]
MSLVRSVAETAEAVPGRRRWERADALVVGCYALVAFLVFHRLWADPGDRYLVDGGQDQNQWEWFFAVTARAVLQWDNPLFTDLQNHPLGVNLMGNTPMLGLSVPLAPVTLLAGPGVTWALVMTGGMIATATAWYRLMVRHLVRERVSAAIGGGFCAFAPPVVSHANAHPNFVVLFVLPFIVGRLIRIAGGGRVVRDGVVLGLLAVYQLFLGEEALLLLATGLVIFFVGHRPSWAVTRRLAAGAGVAAGVALPLVAYPLTWQFFGPQSYDGLIHGPWGNDVAQLTAFARQSLAGHTADGPLDASPTEQNAFFGWPLAVLVVALAVWLWRSALVKALVLVIVAATLLSLGPQIVVNGRPTGIPGPWWVMAQLPLYESVVESRLTMVAVPAIGVLLALGSDRALATPARLMWYLVLVQALLPIAPKPLAVDDRVDAPAFFAEGGWRTYVGEGRSIMPVPPPDAGDAEALHWQVVAGLDFALPEGYFVGPFGPDRQGGYGAVQSPTSRLLNKVEEDGLVPEVGVAERAAFHADLRRWRADAVVLDLRRHRARELGATVAALLGPGRLVGGLWVWDVRALTRATATGRP